MIKENGTVVSVESNEIIVEVLRTSACQSCKARQGCGQATLSEWGDAAKQQAKNHFKIPYQNKDAQVGSVVELGMAPDTISIVAMVVYLVPLVFGFIGIVIGRWVGVNELAQLLFFGIGLLMSYSVMSRIFAKNKTALEPVVLRMSPASKGLNIIESNQLDTV